MKRYLRFTLIIIALALNLNSVTSYADPAQPWYQVELVVFSHINAKALNSEYWPAPTPIATDNPTIFSLVQPSEDSSLDNSNVQNQLTLLPSSKFKLNHEANLISKRPDYQLLLHIAWQQPFSNPAPNEVIHLYGGNAYSDSGSVDAKNAYDDLPFDAKQNWQINGLLNIRVDRYFQVGFNLNFAEPMQAMRSLDNNNQHNVSDDFAYFHFNQSRRMRSNELNYFGHPLYGVLMKISRIPAPAQAQPAST